MVEYADNFIPNSPTPIGVVVYHNQLEYELYNNVYVAFVIIFVLLLVAQVTYFQHVVHQKKYKIKDEYLLIVSILLSSVEVFAFYKWLVS